MRIGFVASPTDPTDPGAIVATKTAAALAQLGHEVVLFSPRWTEDPFEFFGIPRVLDVAFLGPPPRGRAGRVRYALSVTREVRRRGPFDVVDTRNAPSFLGLRRVHSGPIIFEVHLFPGAGVMRTAYRGIARSQDVRLVTNAELIRQELLRAFPALEPGRITVVPLGADAPHGNGQLPDGWPRRADALQVGFVGTLKTWSGTDIVWELARRVPEIDMHVIGKPWHSVDSQQPPNLHVHGFVPQARLSPYLSALDCGLAPLVADRPDGRPRAFPTKVLDYMAHANAIVASDIPVVRDVVDESTALLVPSGDPEAWVAAVRRLDADPPFRRQLASAAQTKFASHYTWRHRAERLVALAL